MQSSQNPIGAASANTTRAHVQSFLEEYEDCWLVCNDNGTEHPIIWIPHHLRHLHRVTSTYQIGFVPPAPYIRVALTDSFRLHEWPTYTLAPAAEESSINLGPEA